MSGRHVLLGHMNEVLKVAAPDQHILLYHSQNSDIAKNLEGRIECYECPPVTQTWTGRTIWERMRLPRFLEDQGADLIFSPAGTISASITLPQISLAQNPWCFVPEARKGISEEIKAALQRRAYREAQHEAELMLYNSDYMRKEYKRNAGREARSGLILYQGIDQDIFDRSTAPLSFEERQCRILVVSAMARHKGLADIVLAFANILQRGIKCTLQLVGPWPDSSYRRSIESLAAEWGVLDRMEILGYVTKDELHRAYQTCRVFCLLSRCESFGIPAIEAQAFGTPSVIADCCAPPEIAGPGGLVVQPGDIVGAADALALLLTDRQQWDDFSKSAIKNAARFTWGNCSAPLLNWINQNDAN